MERFLAVVVVALASVLVESKVKFRVEVVCDEVKRCRESTDLPRRRSFEIRGPNVTKCWRRSIVVRLRLVRTQFAGRVPSFVRSFVR